MKNGWVSLQDGSKVTLSQDGLYFGQERVVLRSDERYRSMIPEDIKLGKIARLLEQGLTADAIFLANFISPISTCALYKANFNPAEPRDTLGLWTRGSDDVASPLLEEIQYRGHFHNAVVDDLIQQLNARGSIAIGHVKISGINGVLAIPDGASLPKGWTKPYFIEVKTGEDPSFTPNQIQVYPLICEGGHAVSFDPRIAQLGLQPGQLLPPMDIMVVHTFGPGLPLSCLSYCQEIGFGGSS